MKQFVIVVLAAFLVGCASSGVKKEDVGVVTGGVVGGFIGSQIGSGAGQLAATAAGAVLGAFIGQQIGRTMDEVDRMKVQQTLETSQTGRTVQWQDPDQNATYRMTPTETYYPGGGQPCREYQFEAEVGGETQQVYGTACRQADGTWKAVS